MLNSITNSAGIKDVFKPFEDEMLFALVMPGERKSNSVKIEEHEEKVTYVHNGATLASNIPSQSTLLESAKRGYSRFLTYNCSLHPEIRNSLLSQKMLPQSLVFHFKDGPMSTTNCSYTLKSSEEVVAESASPPANYMQIQDKELSEIYAALAKLGPEPKLPDQNSVSAAVATLVVHSGKYHVRPERFIRPECQFNLVLSHRFCKRSLVPLAACRSKVDPIRASPWLFHIATRLCLIATPKPKKSVHWATLHVWFIP